MEPVQQLTYRPFAETDIPGILSLWEHSSGWGSITQQQFYDWYVHTPFGICPIIVAENEEGEIVAQLSFIPAAVSIQGKIVKALKLSAPILHKAFRVYDLRKADHPAVAMIREGMSMARKTGYSIFYALPAHAWLGLLKNFPSLGLPPLQMASYDCVSLSIPGSNSISFPRSPGYDAALIEKFDAAFDELWQKAVVSFPIECGIIRNANWLEWKKSNHLVCRIRSGEELVGYAVYRRKDGLLVDILARKIDELKDVLLGSIEAIQCFNNMQTGTPLKELKFMCTRQLQPILEALPVQAVNFQFAFCCLLLTESIAPDQVSPANWYVMPLD